MIGRILVNWLARHKHRQLQASFRRGFSWLVTEYALDGADPDELYMKISLPLPGDDDVAREFDRGAHAAWDWLDLKSDLEHTPWG